MKDAEAIARLKNELRRHLTAARRSPRQIFLELYAGKGGVATKLRARGHGAMNFEIDDGDEYDLLRPAVRKLLLGWLAAGVVRGVWLGTTCSSWSRARRGPPHSAWCAIRSNRFINGLPNLRPKDQHKVELGNRTMRQSAEFILACIRSNTPVMLENPATSMAWLFPPIARLLKQSSCYIINLDQCAYGTPWRKATRVASWHCGTHPELACKCSGRKGICSFSKKHHIVLSGASKTAGVLWTSLAQGYPSLMSSSFARVLADAANNLQLKRLSQMGGGL
jgi:hypothetical protein